MYTPRPCGLRGQGQGHSFRPRAIFKVEDSPQGAIRVFVTTRSYQRDDVWSPRASHRPAVWQWSAVPRLGVLTPCSREPCPGETVELAAGSVPSAADLTPATSRQSQATNNDIHTKLSQNLSVSK